MEKRIKALQSQLLELNSIIHGTVYEIGKLEIQLVPLENSLNRLNHNIDVLKSDKVFIVSMSVYAQLKLELSLIEIKYKKVYNLLEKYRNYLDELIGKKTEILDETNALNEKMESQRKVITFDLSRKKNGQK